jgi:hypothetical protein
MGVRKTLPVFAAAFLLPASAADLAIPINLKCTTCDDFIRCTATAATPDASSGQTPATVYRLREKTFWAQIATIGDYLVQFLREKTTDERPFAVYVDSGAARRIEYDPDARARIDAIAATISLRQESIDQRDGAWRGAAGALLGQCVAMPRKKGYALVREFLGRPALASGAAP